MVGSPAKSPKGEKRTGAADISGVDGLRVLWFLLQVSRVP